MVRCVVYDDHRSRGFVSAYTLGRIKHRALLGQLLANLVHASTLVRVQAIAQRSKMNSWQNFQTKNKKRKAKGSLQSTVCECAL